MTHSARSSLSDLSVQTLPLTPAAPQHKRTPSQTYFSLAEDGFVGTSNDARLEVEAAQGFEKFGSGEGIAMGISVVAVLSLAAVAATFTFLRVNW
ncbi:hypothetical protein CTheo_3607 [Ceratobasidium theobromae]|uniref:Transmembrane protein n=1 Tax=Ceratobasidium theobromae TaxID=1582974 RepID=A0A5N5QMF1_9AGAM|nr:hypothetical protein CTheo_3607 [Ceratobasidium theobromae]